MPNLPNLIILVISFGGMLFIIVRRWPELRAIEILPFDQPRKTLKERIRQQAARSSLTKNFSTEKFLKKILVKTKILFMKGERQADHYLRRVSHSEKFKDDYWDKMDKN